MRRLSSRATALLALAVLACASPASAATNQESTFQDDPLLVFGSDATVIATLDTLHSLGVDRIRVSLFWRVVAPAGGLKTKPAGFDGADPAAYPQGNWARFDALIAAAQARGIAVNLDVTSPAPLWATGHPARADIEQTYTPDPKEFGAFVHAAAVRYSGAFVLPGAPGSAAPATPPTPPPGIPGLPPIGRAAPREGPRVAAGTRLPRVDYWEIYNEPNQAGWLTPQWLPDPRKPSRFIETAPSLYRGLLDAGWAALQSTGHGRDTILAGSTAPKGLNVQGITRSIKPLRFLRLLYCLDGRYRPLHGGAATARGCPATPDARAFTAAHPALFQATGWAHHPYELTFAPTMTPTDPDFVTIANLPRLTGALARSLAAYGRRRSAGTPLYLTEFGYQTNPPDKLGVTLAQQSAYIDESEFISYANPNVRTLSQFLLRDDAPGPGGDYGASFQSGLETLQGAKKPSYTAYKLPIFLPERKFAGGRSLRVWGLVRTAANGTPAGVAVQWRKGRGSAWRTVRTVMADGARGYVDRRVRFPGSGDVRLAADGGHSRSVSVRRR